ncbi:hypothetical protein [Rhodococcus sp. YH3-3]
MTLTHVLSVDVIYIATTSGINSRPMAPGRWSATTGTSTPSNKRA